MCSCDFSLGKAVHTSAAGTSSRLVTGDAVTRVSWLPASIVDRLTWLVGADGSGVAAAVDGGAGPAAGAGAGGAVDLPAVRGERRRHRGLQALAAAGDASRDTESKVSPTLPTHRPTDRPTDYR